ncbi:MAG: hypothetical protein FJZ01_09345 [Candidatus Sericytochromatia bacterium]|nr:hypothetical protein [Candidatus Tanganyikabacteria bacterium]
MTRVPAAIAGLGLCVAVAACGRATAPPPLATQVAHEGAQGVEQEDRAKAEVKEEMGEEARKKVEEEIRSEVEEEEADEADEVGKKDEESAEPAAGRQIQAVLSVDPCKFASAEQLKTLITKPLLDLFPKKYKKYVITPPKSINMKCPDMKLSLSTGIKRKIKWLPDISGKLALESPVTAKVTTGADPGQVEKARACMGQIKLVKLDFKYVPSFLEKGMRFLVNKGLNTILPEKVFGDVTPLAKQYTAKGGKL